jgi:hypothetical protein
MSTESQLREKLRKSEALFAGAGTAGERLAPTRPSTAILSLRTSTSAAQDRHLTAPTRASPLPIDVEIYK